MVFGVILKKWKMNAFILMLLLVVIMSHGRLLFVIIAGGTNGYRGVGEGRIAAASVAGRT